MASKGKLLFWSLALIPAIIWSLMMPLPGRFSSLARSLQSIGQLSGLIGMALFSLVIIITSRIRPVENLFGGLDRAYRSHHSLGIAAFILLLIHPAAIFAQFLTISLGEMLQSLIIAPGLAVRLGSFALLALASLLLITLYAKIKYERWLFSHKFLGLAYALAGAHIILISSDISGNAFLRYYMLFLFGLGFASFAYRTLGYRYLVKKYGCTIESLKVKGMVTEITLAPKKESIKHLPGQFIFIRFPSLGRQIHPFTISSHDQVRISAKQVGDYTKELPKLKIGDPAVIEGPYGRFFASKKDQIWIAGGIGITPFLAMSGQKKRGHADLFYQTKDPSEAIYIEELQNQPNLNLVPHYSGASGHITAKQIAQTAGLDNKCIFICGPKAMMQDLKRQFHALGVDKKRIRTEEFALRS